MLNPKQELFRWGPIPGRLITVDDWSPISHLYTGRLHRYYWPDSYTIFHGGEMMFISDLSELEATTTKVFTLLEEKHRLEYYLRFWNKSVRNLFNYCRHFTPAGLAKLEDGQLEDEWKKFHDLLRPFWEVAVIPEMGAYGGTPILHRALIKHGLDGEALQLSAAVLSAPEQLSFYQIEERDFLKLYRLRSKTVLNKAFQKHFAKYYWIENSYGATEFLTLAGFKKKFRDGKPSWRQREKAISIHLPRLTKQKKSVVKKYRITGEIQKIAQRLSLCIGWQDERKKQIFRYLYYLELFLREFSNRSGISRQLLSTAMVSEITTKPSTRQINKWRWRAKHVYVLDLGLHRYRVITGRLANKIFRNYWPLRRRLVKSALTGIVAHPGPERITGRVFVVRNHDQLKRFPAGAVLVSTQTAPEYIAAIRKAKAIVTDFGGITSHAAIVAREYNKPCVVGTAYATASLKTGDKVIINARCGEIIKQ